MRACARMLHQPFGPPLTVVPLSYETLSEVVVLQNRLARPSLPAYAALALVFVLASCGQDQSVEGPGITTNDSASQDSGAVDAGSTTNDTSTAPQDTGSAPKDTGSTAPEDTGSTAPEDTGSTAPHDSGSTAPQDAGTTTPGDSGSTAPDDSGSTAPDDSGSTAPDDSGSTAPDDSGSIAPDDSGSTAPEDAGSTPQDSGSSSPDAGTTGPDSGSTQADARQADAGQPDAGQPTGCKSDNECAAKMKLTECAMAKCDAGQCKAIPKKDGTKCGDGNKCLSGATCQAGKCASGKAITCDDGNPCTDDKCTPATGLCGFSANIKPCDDGNKCTLDDRCNNGKCKPQKQLGCDDKNPCTVDKCDPKTGKCSHAKGSGKCDDGNKCTDKDVCGKDGKCNGALKACDDGNPCTKDGCDPKTGCIAKNADGAPCSDNAKCIKGSCKAGKCAATGAKGCNDNNPCTTDKCDGKKGCVYTAGKDGMTCKDGSKCVDASTCKAGKCVPGKKADCDDGNPCTTDTCDPKVGCSWGANTNKCNDGNACTGNDACANGQCAGKKIDAEKACGDGNGCTKASCDPKKGCSNTKITGACDDGSVCTKGEACKDGKCQGGTNNKCDDGKQCTKDSCNPKTGACSWGASDGPCDDGNKCTSAGKCNNGKCQTGPAKSCDDKNTCTKDSCNAKTGACVHSMAGAVGTKCDDGNKCTKDTKCASTGKCEGKAEVCDDGNACTKDVCNAATGKCGFSANDGATCDVGPCTTGDSCKNGKCNAGTSKSCNDGNSCTVDSCDNKTGKCSYSNGKDGTKCDDGTSCTTGDSCKAGKCAAGTNNCGWKDLDYDFACGKMQGWTTNNSNQNNVKWAVDNTPGVGALKPYGCTLNMNDGKDYCHSSWGNGCRQNTSGGWARSAFSPWLDATKVKGAITLKFDAYYDLDSGDTARCYVYRQGSNSALHVMTLASTGCAGGSCMKTLRKDMTMQLTKVAGQKFRVRFAIFSNTSGNKGAGFFVDNVRLFKAPDSPEVCNNGKDDDGDGLKDCADPDCKSLLQCKEVCGDGKDNDLDDKVDCADSDCKGHITCADTIYKTAFDCGELGWTQATTKTASGVKWAIDATPSSVKPRSAKCTLNFNNGKNYCGKTSCNTNDSSSSNDVAGIVVSKEFDATIYKTLQLNFWEYQAMATNSWNRFDSIYVQVSANNFAGCCGAQTVCNNSNARENCNITSGGKAMTRTYRIPRSSGTANKWNARSLNLGPSQYNWDFTGRKFKVRFRFNSRYGNNKTGAGAFIDDLIIRGIKK